MLLLIMYLVFLQFSDKEDQQRLQDAGEEDDPIQ